MGNGKPRTINPKCRVCGEPLTEKNWYWYHNKSRKGINLVCKTCWCKRKKDLWKKHHYNIGKNNPNYQGGKNENQYKHDYYLKHKNKCALQSKDWRLNHRLRSNELNRNSKLKHPETARNGNYKRKYGITLEEYNSILLKQNGKCAICENDKVGRNRTKYFIIDHDHKTNKVRGLLCDQCNKGLGHFKDSKELLLKATKYLESE